MANSTFRVFGETGVTNGLTTIAPSQVDVVRDSGQVRLVSCDPDTAMYVAGC